MGNSNFAFQLDTTSGIPFYRQLIQQVELGISRGTLQAGYRLPTIRALAIDLKINPNTIAKAYNEMELKGLVVTQVGSGTYVSNQKVSLDEIEQQKKIDELCARFIAGGKMFGLSKEELITVLTNYKGE